MLDLLPNPNDTLRDVSVETTFKVRVFGSLAIGGFPTPGAAIKHFTDRGYTRDQLTITPETTLVIR